MKNARGDGRTMVWTVTGSDVTSGDFVQVGDVVGVAAEDAAVGDDVTLWIEGEYEGPTTGSPALGAALDWNGSAWAAAVGDTGQGVHTRDAGGNVGWIKLTPA